MVMNADPTLNWFFTPLDCELQSVASLNKRPYHVVSVFPKLYNLPGNIDAISLDGAKLRTEAASISITCSIWSLEPQMMMSDGEVATIKPQLGNWLW